ncbi:MAG TPA: DNA mismatch repair endonuclease MutL [bacterium]|nr:DNA mismatch repair endonuclease MutL [bacterium]
MATTTGAERLIAVLPEHLIDQIAAGEVIERPASVVKELVENALDARAGQIDIAVKQAGAEEIRVVDNGAGMSPADLPQAILRHATSKIRDAEDLDAILTFGFRGEALAAIASIAHLEIVSRRRQDEAAAMMFWEAGTRSDSGIIGAPVGTAVTVRHLFYNTPARREYLRAPTTEIKRIIETVIDFAAWHHRVGFTLLLDGKPALQVAPAERLEDRLADLFGARIRELLVPFAAGDAELGVSGFAGKPELSRSSRDRILLYVNGRRVWSQSLQHAATNAYGETIPRGRYPFAVIAVAVNPRRVDVNVHPTKREVRFAHDRAVYDLIYYGINKAIFASPRTAPTLELKPSYTPPVTSERLPFPPVTVVDPVAAHTPAIPSSIGTDLPHVAEVIAEPHAPVAERGEADTGVVVTRDQRMQEQAVPDVASFWQFRDLYIVTVVGEELWVIDQHTAHERIQYEAILRRALERRPETQRMLFPESIDLEPREWQTYEQAGDVVASLGFEVRAFGQRTVLLEGVPTGLRVKNPVILFRRVLEDVETARRGGEDLLKAAAASAACRSAVMSGDRLKPEEMQSLFARLMHTENPFSCPHGRPTVVRIPIFDFDKKFCRA